MDSRIIEFLRSGCCDCVATVTVQRDELRGARDEKSALPTVIGSGVSVGEVWGRCRLMSGCRSGTSARMCCICVMRMWLTGLNLDLMHCAITAW